MSTPNIDAALDWLYSTQLFGIKLGVENTQDLLREAGCCHPEATVIHVAGTNGKGSVCAMIESIGRAQGLRTGLFTSPHLIHFSERIRINGVPISDDALLKEIHFARLLAEKREPSPTFFELTLLMALHFFAEKKVDLIILETGLGGRLDATNAVPKDLAVLTPIGLDHQQILGDTLEKIAAEKASIMASGKPVVVAKQPIEAMAVIERMAIERQSELHVVEVTEETPVPGLSGRHQIENAALAIESMKLLNLLPTPDILKATLSQVSWPGRFERISGPELVLDGAHNEHAARVLVQTWKEYYSEKKAAFVFAASADKDIKAMIPVVREIVGEWHLVPVSSPRIMPPQEMAELLAGMGVEGITIHDSLQAGLTAALESSLSTLVAGSLFLVGDVKALLQNVDKRTTSQ